MKWYKISNLSYNPELEGLAAEARKCHSFEEFEKDFLQQIKHGRYYHITHDPNFKIDSNLGPTDMSSLSSGKKDIGKLMITSHLNNWLDDYSDRPYVAVIDMSKVDPKSYCQVNRGFGNEFFVSDPSKAKVEKVLTVEQAISDDSHYNSILPQSSEELKKFYNSVTGDAL